MTTHRAVQALLLAVLCGPCLGCGSAEQPSGGTSDRYDAGRTVGREASSGPGETAAPGDAAPAADSPQGAARNRKIIYNAKVRLVVDDYQSFESQIVQLVSEHGGFVANSDTTRRYTDRQSGTWRVRVPVAQYTDFLTAVTSLGFAESRNEDAQDVSEEFVDIEARIRSKQELERRIIAMLEDRAGKLADVLEIEKELARVREDIERMEGRLRYLADRSSLATITIECREEQKYVPAEAPTFASRVTRSWSGSLSVLRALGEVLVIGLVASTPWMVTFAVPLTLGLIVARRYRP